MLGWKYFKYSTRSGVIIPSFTATKNLQERLLWDLQGVGTNVLEDKLLLTKHIEVGFPLVFPGTHSLTQTCAQGLRQDLSAKVAK